jgi:hypothetical protein
MRIEVQKSGGVAGLLRPVDAFDTDNLSPEDSHSIRRLVDAADFFNLPPEIAPGPERDSFTYRINVESGGRSHTVRTGKHAAPAPLRDLIERLDAMKP